MTRWALLWLGAAGCVLELPPPLEPDGCPGTAVPCGTQCIEATELCTPKDFRGAYTVSLRAADNGCAFDGWMEGNTLEAPVTITMEGADVELRVEGFAGALLALDFFAEPVFFGTAVGDTFEARAATMRSLSEGGCAWRNAPSVRAWSTGENAFEGVLEYRIEANGHPDCPAFFADCVSVQPLVASRPPPGP